jgi:hypothetical protein
VKWISVNTRLPKECQRVWAWFGNKRGRYRGRFSDAMYYWPETQSWSRTDCTPLEDEYKVSHWTQLPDPPKEK